MIEPDGEQAAMCGNGLGCAAAFLAAGQMSQADRLAFRVGMNTSMPRTCEVEVASYMGRWHFEVGLGAIRSTPVEFLNTSVLPSEPALADISALRDRVFPPQLRESYFGGSHVFFVFASEPHLVVLTERAISSELVVALGDFLNMNCRDIWPLGINVMLARHSSGACEYRSYERNLFRETLSCGTGAASVVAVLVNLGMVPRGQNVLLDPPGVVDPALPNSPSMRQWARITTEGATIGGRALKLAQGELCLQLE